MNNFTPIDTDQPDHLKDLTGLAMDELGIAHQLSAAVTPLRNTGARASFEEMCELLSLLVAFHHDRLSDPAKRDNLTASDLNAVASLLRDLGVTGAVRSALARRRAAAEAVEAQALADAAAAERPATGAVRTMLPAGVNSVQAANSADEAGAMAVEDGVDPWARFRTAEPASVPGAAVDVDGAPAPGYRA